MSFALDAYGFLGEWEGGIITSSLHLLFQQ